MADTRHIRALTSERGGALIVTLMILGAMALLGTAIVFNAMSDRSVSRYGRDAADALAAAETGIAVAENALKTLTAPLEDADGDGYFDFELADTLDWGGHYRVIGEATEIRGIDAVSAYRSQGFNLVSEGNVRGAKRRVQVEFAKESFLKFARFVATTGTGYGCRDDVEAELYVGGNLNIATCAVGEQPRFLEHVTVTGDINNPTGAEFMRGFTEHAPEIDILGSVDFDEIADQARGSGTRSACEYGGAVGLYVNLPTTDPIGISSTGDWLNLSLFDFHDTTTSPGNTIITYNGVPCENVTTGAPLRLEDFNGIIFFARDAHVFGTMDGRSGHSMSIYADRDVYVEGSIYTGTTGFDAGTGAPNGTGDPVNLGLIGHYYVYLGDVPQIVQIDAAIMAVRRNWRARNPGMSAHPPMLTGPVDLDMDQIVGETPVNHDPDPFTGWDELNLTTDHWVLNLNGPLITYDGASAVPWSSGTVEGIAAGRITWQYNYDHDIREFPPPCFPNPLNSWKRVSWREIFDGEGDLASHLP